VALSEVVAKFEDAHRLEISFVRGLEVRANIPGMRALFDFKLL